MQRDAGGGIVAERGEPTEDEIWKVRREVNRAIPKIRKEAYAISAYRRRGPGELVARSKKAPPETLERGRDGLHPTRGDKPLRVWAIEMEEWAARQQKLTEGVGGGATPRDLLEVTSRAGRLLGATESLMFTLEAVDGGHEDGKAQRTPPRPLDSGPLPHPAVPAPANAEVPRGAITVSGQASEGVPPKTGGLADGSHRTNQREESTPRAPRGGRPARQDDCDAGIVLQVASMVVYTARDQTDAAYSLAQNLRARIAHEESYMVTLLFASTAFLYFAFHPVWGWWLRAPFAAWPYYDVIFVSIWGSMAQSILTIVEESKADTFDPRLHYKYHYRIPLAPLFAYVALLVTSVMNQGMTAGAGVLGLEGYSWPLLVILSFIFGFYAKRALDLIDFGAQKMVPRRTAEGEKATTKEQPSLGETDTDAT